MGGGGASHRNSGVRRENGHSGADMANQAKAQPCPPAALIRRPWVPGAGCLREPPRLRGEAKADGRDLAGTVETAVGDAHGKGGGDGPAHMGTATSCWPLRGWASDPTARGPGGPARSGCPGPSTSARRPQCPDARGPAQAHQCLAQNPPFLQNPARILEEAAPASGFMSGEGDAEFEMECFKTISPA